MAHPHDAVRRDIGEQGGGIVGDVQIDLPVFGLLRRFDHAAGHPCHQLAAVADAEHRDAERQDLCVVMRGRRVEHRVRAAGEDDAFVVGGGDLLDRRGVGQDLREHMVVADAAGDQLIVLPAEIEYQNFFHKNAPLIRPSRQNVTVIPSYETAKPSRAAMGTSSLCVAPPL